MQRLFPFLLLVLIIILLGQILVSYGVFETDVEVPTDTPIAAWQIHVNGNQLLAEPQIFNITDIYWDHDPNVLPGRAAPNLEGYFEIIIDPSGTEVGIEYELIIGFSEIDNDFIIIQGVKDSDDTELVEVDFETYRGTISLSDVLANKIETITVTFSWINDENNNIIDSQMANEFNAQLMIPVEIKVIQQID